MKAIVRDRYGSTDVLALADIDRPLVGDDEVLVRVRAAGVDQGVWHVMAGLPYPIRVAGFGLRAPKNVPRRVRASDHQRVQENRLLFERFADKRDPMAREMLVERFLPLARRSTA